MKNAPLILLIILILPLSSFSQIDSTDILAGKKMTMSSEVLNYNPEIYIGLPANFNDTTTYPVIVLLDAEWLFPAFSGITKLMGQMEEIPGCVVVGLPLNDSFKDYGMEFAPKITGVPQSGHADKILEFFSKELFPFIESKYNGSKERIIWAHSAPGGLFCTYLLLGSDVQFSGIISSSPNLRGNQEYINAENAFEKLSQKDTMFYYLSFGTNENEMFMGTMYQQVQEFKAKLDKDAPENLKWIYRDNENSNHLTNALKSYIDGIKLYFEMME
jgi:predicted alpha/beta superfamily hydrolase